MPAPYFIYANGRAKPRRAQPDIESARAEARRVFAINEGRHDVLILETCEKITSGNLPARSGSAS